MLKLHIVHTSWKIKKIECTLVELVLEFVAKKSWILEFESQFVKIWLEICSNVRWTTWNILQHKLL
jgi:hypothetical protein